MKLDPKNAALARKTVDAACRKVSVTVKFRSGESAVCEGYEFRSIAGEAMVVHRSPPARGAGNGWQVTEPVTGRLICNGYKTRDAAMIDAQARVNRRPGCLNDAIRQHGIEREVATERAA